MCCLQSGSVRSCAVVTVAPSTVSEDVTDSKPVPQQETIAEDKIEPTEKAVVNEEAVVKKKKKDTYTLEKKRYVRFLK